MPNTTPNSPDRNELREQIKQVRSNNASLASQLEPAAIDEIIGVVGAYVAALQQTIEAEAKEYDVTDLEKLEHRGEAPLVATPLSTITKAFEAAKAEKDSK